MSSLPQVIQQYNNICSKLGFATCEESVCFESFLDHLWHTSGGANERDSEWSPSQKLCMTEFYDFLTTVMPGVVMQNDAILKINILRESYLIKPIYKSLSKLTKAGVI